MNKTDYKKVKGALNIDVIIKQDKDKEIIIVEVRFLGFLIKTKKTEFLTVLLG